MPDAQPNVVFVLVDQLRARSLSLYQRQLPDSMTRYPLPIETPNIDRLARQGVTLDDVISTCPVCTPYRAMLQTGRHPQTTGHIINSTRTRWSEIGLADAFGQAGYRTAYIGKWHLHTGAWPANDVKDWVPIGRDRLGWQHWRGYNQHMLYFDGFVHGDDWNVRPWQGYETEALWGFASEFLDEHQAQHPDDPFFLFLSPHQPHYTHGKFAPDDAYADLPEVDDMELPANVADTQRTPAMRRFYRHYLAMIVMIDRLVGEVLDDLERRGLLDDTLLVFTSDHGTMGGSHGHDFWAKKQPQEEAIAVPWVMRLPGEAHAGARRGVLTSPVDLFPSLCGLCGVPVPQSVEGRDLSAAWIGESGEAEQDAVLLMSFSAAHDHFADGMEWRGVRTKAHTYARFLDGREFLYDLAADPLQEDNLAGVSDHMGLKEILATRMAELQRQRADVLQPCEAYRPWLDSQRRVIRNAFGPLPHPEQDPDWSLLSPA